MVFQHHFVIFDQCESKRKVVSGANLGCWRPRDSVITATPGRRITLPPAIGEFSAGRDVRRTGEGKQPPDFLEPSQLHLLQHADDLHPSKRLLHSLSFLLAQFVTDIFFFKQKTAYEI